MNIRLATYYHAKDVPALPGSNIFHSTELFHVLEQTRGVRPLLLVAYEGKSPVFAGSLRGEISCGKAAMHHSPLHQSATFC